MEICAESVQIGVVCYRQIQKKKRELTMKKSMRIFISCIAILLAAAVCLTVLKACEPYSKSVNWVYLETDATGKSADTFFVCPTVFSGADGSMNWTQRDQKTLDAFIGATNMEKGLYDGDTRFFAPLYEQTSLYAYQQDAASLEKSLDRSYSQIRQAFQYYLKHYNNGRPIILAGFSQGADMCVRLLKEFFGDEKLNSQLVACYAIGWYITEEEMAVNPHIRFASGEDDTGVLIMFGTESPDAEPCVVHPADVKSLCINPLNWKTDATPADRSLNKGACFTDYSGSITKEIPELTGAYIEPSRGVLIAPDVTPEDYPAHLSFAKDGIYHIYDYQFFYRNLQENVAARIAAYLA